jgi:hypothetical protein
MSNGQALTAGDFGPVFRDFLQQAVANGSGPEPFFSARLTGHFGVAPTTLAIVSETFPVHDHPNVQMAMDAYLAEPGRRFELLGVSSERKRMGYLALGDLVGPATGGLWASAPGEGPVDYSNLPVGDGRKLACVQFGLYLVHDGDRPLAVLVRGADSRGFGQAGVSVEVMAVEQAAAEEFLADLRNRARTHNVYRGHVVSLSQPMHGPLQVKFHDLKPVDRADIVLPAGVLDRIERQTIRFAKLNHRMRAAGRHLKRGLLLWGPPGTGKTLTAMYLARQMPERTVLVLTGQTLGLIETSCSMARLLQPATLILEDVDLVAEERSRQGVGANSVLFELLNQMDGLGEDADVLFVLTTNRPELLEPALASRPGRVDQAIEVPLPDGECRSRLLDLYGQGLVLELSDRDGIVQRTEGASAAFIKELLRKATLFAIEADGDGDGEGDERVLVTDRHLDQALLELTVEGGALTKTLLGLQPLAGKRPSC